MSNVYEQNVNVDKTNSSYNNNNNEDNSNYKKRYNNKKETTFDPSKLKIFNKWEIADDEDPQNKFGTAVTVQKYDEESTKVKISRYGVEADNRFYENRGVKISADRPEVLRELSNLLLMVAEKIENKEIQ